MLRLFQKSSVLGTSARLVAPSSTIASKHERNMSTKKGVVINLGGCIVPAMSPVLSKYAREHSITESDLVTKLFKEGDQGLMAQIEPALLSRHGSEQASLAHIISAVQSIRGEGLTTGLVANAGGLNGDLLPVDKSLFDVVAPALKADMLDKMQADSSELVYLDNLDANIKAAQALGMHAIKVTDVESTLKELEAALQVPLKEFVPGLTWIYYDGANNPYKSTKDNLLYYFLCIYIFMVSGSNGKHSKKTRDRWKLEMQWNHGVHPKAYC